MGATSKAVHKSSNKKRRELWRQQNRCLAHGYEKPCYKCNESRAINVDFCLECLTAGGDHRYGCSKWRKARRAAST